MSFVPVRSCGLLLLCCGRSCCTCCPRRTLDRPRGDAGLEAGALVGRLAEAGVVVQRVKEAARRHFLGAYILDLPHQYVSLTLE